MARQPETRQHRISQAVSLVALNIRANHPGIRAHDAGKSGLPILVAGSCHSRGCRGQVGTLNGLIWTRSANHHPTSCLRQIGGYACVGLGQQL